MRTSPFALLRFLRLAAVVLAAAGALVTPPAQAQLQYPPGNFDVQIVFGCNCTCFCGSNGMAINNPIGAFLAVNPVDKVSSSTRMPQAGQVVPPHYTLFPPAPFTPP